MSSDYDETKNEAIDKFWHPDDAVVSRSNFSIDDAEPYGISEAVHDALREHVTSKQEALELIRELAERGETVSGVFPSVVHHLNGEKIESWADLAIHLACETMINEIVTNRRARHEDLRRLDLARHFNRTD